MPLQLHTQAIIIITSSINILYSHTSYRTINDNYLNYSRQINCPNYKQSSGSVVDTSTDAVISSLPECMHAGKNHKPRPICVVVAQNWAAFVSFNYGHTSADVTQLPNNYAGMLCRQTHWPSALFERQLHRSIQASETEICQIPTQSYRGSLTDRQLLTLKY